MDYLEVNKKGWNQRTKLHLQSQFYDMKGFKEGKTSLKEIELALLGDIEGKDILHLQCHFGQDSISLARMGANVTAVDLAPDAIEAARTLSDSLSTPVKFICSDVLAHDLLANRTFDMVFATYGTIPWLPNLKPWAELIKNKLRPGGRLVFVEFHPVIDLFDDAIEEIKYSYFNVEKIAGHMQGSYAEDGPEEIPYVVWNHPLDEVMGSLMNTGLALKHFKEYPFSPYPCFAGMKEISPGRHIIEKFGDKLPLCFSLILENE